MNELITECTSVWMSRQKNEWMNKKDTVDGRMDGWMNDWMNMFVC